MIRANTTSARCNTGPSIGPNVPRPVPTRATSGSYANTVAVAPRSPAARQSWSVCQPCRAAKMTTCTRVYSRPYSRPYFVSTPTDTVNPPVANFGMSAATAWNPGVAVPFFKSSIDANVSSALR
jgi:hypothetical protein